MEALRALGALCEPPSDEHPRLAAALGLPTPPPAEQHTDLFAFRLYPYASVYLGGEGQLGGEVRDRVAGFWHALGLVPPAEPDHLAALLGLYAALADAGRDAADPARSLLLREARRALLHEHLLPWTEPFLARVRELGDPFYGAWAALLEATLADQVDRLGRVLTIPVALRDAPGLDPPAAVGGRAFLAQLLVPVRTGCILVRDDLMTAGRELGLGVRIAERRFVLEALVAQDAAATFGWLATFAAGQAAGRRPGFWRARADSAAGVLLEAAAQAAGQGQRADPH
jgi:nitrate reductase assembly molybdenum cofactor insertion protein NarJ